MLGWREIAHIIVRQVNQQEKDIGHLHIIDKDAWTEHYR